MDFLYRSLLVFLLLNMVHVYVRLNNYIIKLFISEPVLEFNAQHRGVKKRMHDNSWEAESDRALFHVSSIYRLVFDHKVRLFTGLWWYLVHLGTHLTSYVPHTPALAGTFPPTKVEAPSGGGGGAL
jgi:hypothetical protein